MNGKTVIKDICSILGTGRLMILAFMAIMYAVVQLNQDRIGTDYTAMQTQKFDQKALTEMSNDFNSSSNDAQRYSKNKSNTFKKMILTDALTDNDLNTLMQIYKKDPTKINKIYVLACAWNSKYDNNNLTKYGKSLNYYTQHLTPYDKELISPYLQEIIKSCTGDPTGVMQKWDIFETHSGTSIVKTDCRNHNIH